MIPTLATEQPHPDHPRLDEYDAQQLVAALVDDQALAAQAVRAAAPAIAQAVEAAVPRLEAGGRLIYVGAGTSGRLGLLDSAELPPTFSWPYERAVALLAGGLGAVQRAVEGAEDDADLGGADISAVGVCANDVVLLLAASGTTPYVLGALTVARAAGALTIGIANNDGAPVAAAAEIGIVLDTGPEIISGSTRLKAGTAQKIALNTFSSAVMVRMHKVYGNLMVDMKATNSKLVRRAVRLTSIATGADEATARTTLQACGYEIKVAIVAIAGKMDVATARARLAAANGSARDALKT